MRIFAAVAAAVILSSSAFAHDVPDDVVVQAFLHPSGTRVSLVVRVPLTAMRDVDVPSRAGGFVDLTRVDPALRHPAPIWLDQGIELLQNGRAKHSVRGVQSHRLVPILGVAWR